MPDTSPKSTPLRITEEPATALFRRTRTSMRIPLIGICGLCTTAKLNRTGRYRPARSKSRGYSKFKFNSAL